MKLRLIQAYQQTPWRSQIKWGSRFLLVLVLAVMIAGLYLSISAQVATAGVEIQDNQFIKGELQREIADLSTQLAFLTSAREMEQRAESMEFSHTNFEQTKYVIVAGYSSPKPVNLAPPPGVNMIPQSLVKTAYTRSLWDWMSENALDFGSKNISEKP
jgi:hypothetical protein